MPAASVLPPRPAASQQRTWTPPALRSEGRARPFLLQKGSELFVQVGVGRPAGVGRRRPGRRSLHPRAHAFLPRGRRGQSFLSGGPAGEQVGGWDVSWERHRAWTCWARGWGRAVAGGQAQPGNRNPLATHPLEGSHLLLSALSRPASFSRTVLSPPLLGDPGSGRLPPFSPPLLVNFLFGSSGAPGSLIPGSLERFTNIN